MIESRGALVPTGSQYGSYGWSGSTLAFGSTHLGDINLSHLFRRLSYAEMFRRHPAVFTVVDKRGDLVARLPLKVYRPTDGGREVVRSSPFARLLAAPCREMSRFEFVKRLSVHDDLYGEWIVAKVRDAGGQVVELIPLVPWAVEVTWDESGQRFYDVHGERSVTRLAPSEVVHHRRVDPENPWRGLSPLEPLRATLDNTAAARAAMASFWARGARPGLALVHPGQLTQSAADRLKSQFDAIAAGAHKTGSTVVLEEGMEPKPMMLTAEESQYLETRKYDDREIYAAYHMPPTAVGDLEHATYSNVTENLRSVYRDTIAPRLQGFESTIASQLAVDFAGDEYAEFLMDEVLRGAFEQRVDAYQAAINAGWMTPAEVRELENLPFVEGSDVLLANQTLAPFGESSLDPKLVEAVGALIRAGFEPAAAAAALGLPEMAHSGLRPVTLQSEAAIDAQADVVRGDLPELEVRHSLTTKARLAGMLAQAWRTQADRHAYILRRKVERALRKQPDWTPAGVGDLLDADYHRASASSILTGPLTVAYDAYGRDDADERIALEVAETVDDLTRALARAVGDGGDLLASIDGIGADLAGEADGWADDVLEELEGEQ